MKSTKQQNKLTNYKTKEKRLNTIKCNNDFN